MAWNVTDATAYNGMDNHLILAAIALVSGHSPIRIPHPQHGSNATADTTGAAVEPSTIYNATERSEYQLLCLGLRCYKPKADPSRTPLRVHPLSLYLVFTCRPNTSSPVASRPANGSAQAHTPLLRRQCPPAFKCVGAITRHQTTVRWRLGHVSNPNPMSERALS